MVSVREKIKTSLLRGLIIVNDLVLEDGSWEEGTILDPKSGKVYDCYLTLEAEDKLKVRGFLGFSILGRTQNWIRK